MLGQDGVSSSGAPHTRLPLAAVLTATSACPAVFDEDAYDFPIVTYKAGEACSFGVSIGTNIIEEQDSSSTTKDDGIMEVVSSAQRNYTIWKTDDKAILHCLTDLIWNKTVTTFEDGTQSGVESGSNWIQLSPQDIGLNNLVGPGLYLMEGGTFEWRVDENGIWTVASAMGSFSNLCETVSGSPSLSPTIPSSSTRLMVVSGMTGSLALFVSAFIL